MPIKVRRLAFERPIARPARRPAGHPPGYQLLVRRRPGLIFGYATLAERALAEGIEILAEAISDVRSR